MLDKKGSYLAENLKAFRMKRNYTQEDFSKLSGLARSTITNIESGEANPSISNVIKISEALGVSIDQLISKPRSSILLLKEEDLIKEVRGKYVEIYKLFPDKIKDIAIDRVVIKSGEVFRGSPHLSGTKEYLTVIKGTLQITINNEQITVEENQVLAFPGDVNHAYRNIGKGNLEYISIVLPFTE